jgi:predicted dehydrogenase
MSATNGPRLEGAMTTGLTRPIRLGIVGLGWGANHARVAAELSPLVEVRAICSRRRERLTALASELDLPAAALETDWARLVARSDVDLVINTTPDALHHPITLAAVAEGKHVMTEKPLAMTAEQAAEMLAAAEAAGVAHFTGFTWRFAPPFATLRRLLDSGALGTVRFLDGHFRIGPPLPGKEWQFDPAQRAGGVLGNLGVHLIDLVRYLVAAAGGDSGASGVADLAGWRVWARCDLAGRASDVEPPATQPDPPGGAPAGEVNDLVWLHLQLGDDPGAAQARLQVSQLLTLRATDPVRLEVHGTAASAIGYANPLAPDRQRLRVFERTSETGHLIEPLDFPGGPPAPPTAALPSGGLLRPTIRHFYQAHIVPRLRRGEVRPDTPTFHDGWLAQRVMAAAMASARQGRWVAC